jgi:hypothetical protein
MISCFSFLRAIDNAVSPFYQSKTTQSPRFLIGTVYLSDSVDICLGIQQLLNVVHEAIFGCVHQRGASILYVQAYRSRITTSSEQNTYLVHRIHVGSMLQQHIEGCLAVNIHCHCQRSQELLSKTQKVHKNKIEKAFAYAPTLFCNSMFAPFFSRSSIISGALCSTAACRAPAVFAFSSNNRRVIANSPPWMEFISGVISY